MRSVAAALCLAGILPLSAVAAQQKQINYEIAFPNAAEHEALVTATFSGVPRGSTLHVRMSRSSPGRYSLATFAKNVYDVSAADGKGHTLATGRPDSHGWDVSGHDGTVRVQYKVWGDRIDGTYLSIDHTHAHMNMPATFMWAQGFENAPIRLQVHPNAGWHVATQLVPTSDSAIFTAPNFQWFMDSPTEVGPITWRTWTAAQNGKTSTWRIAVHHLGTEAQVDTFATMAKTVVAEEIAMWGEPAGYDFGTYTFINDYVPWANGDGMEHRNSTILTSRASLSTPASRLGLIFSVAHEFFHSWNMERLRSKEIEPFDFNREDMSSSLWFGEGFTDYYGALLLRRASIYSDDQYLAQLSGSIVATMNTPARQHGSPVDMSREAVFFDGGAYLDPIMRQNTFLSYYAWGSVIAAGLDLTLRSRYHTSLDEYMRLMWRDYGSHQSKALAPERPYTNADLQAQLGKLTHDAAFAADFFRRFVFGREVPDFASLLAPAGYSLVRDSVPHPYLGASLDNDPKGVFVNWSSENGSAYAAGLASGDMILSVDGTPVNAIDSLNAIVSRHHVGDVLKLNVLQKGELPAIVAMPLKGVASMKVVTYETAKLPVTDAIRAFRKDWLGSKVNR